MIIKFDGIDGCGKSTLSRAVFDDLTRRNYSVCHLSEFSSPMEFTKGGRDGEVIESMRIRESVLNPAFDCDDVERQLLLHYLSRRKNRVEIPHLCTLYDLVVVDRSTLSNYAYAGALDPPLLTLSDLAVGEMEEADVIFWIDTPVDMCMTRMRGKLTDAVEQKGYEYLVRVREIFRTCVDMHPAVRVLDGRREIEDLVAAVRSVITNPCD